jgi:hypothetical protein
MARPDHAYEHDRAVNAVSENLSGENIPLMDIGDRVLVIVITGENAFFLIFNDRYPISDAQWLCAV